MKFNLLVFYCTRYKYVGNRTHIAVKSRIIKLQEQRHDMYLAFSRYIALTH